MKVGIKIYPQDLEYAKKIAKYCDFFEVTAIPGSDFRSLKKLGKEFTIHNIHHDWDANPANPSRKKLNAAGIAAAKEAADILGADSIVIHCGHIEDDGCSVESVLDTFSLLDSRFIIENVPAFTGRFKSIGGDFEEMNHILDKTGKKLCLDIAHAAAFALYDDMDYLGYIKKMLTLKPSYFHMSDTKVESKIDMHLHLKEGNLDIGKIKKMLPRSGRILLETGHDVEKQKQDIEILR